MCPTVTFQTFAQDMELALNQGSKAVCSFPTQGMGLQYDTLEGFLL